MKLKIASLKLKNPFILAPMLGVNCPAFRLLCKEYGCSLVSSPMIHVNWLIREKKLPEIIELSKKERPILVQLIGNEPKKVKEAVKIIEPYADIIDLNFGCPQKDVLGLKMGAYLMRYPEKIGKIVNAAVSSTNLPVTAKIRSGFDDNCINALKVGKIIENNGASAVTLHARTMRQVYSGKADWELIKQLKETLNIPVIGNGDALNANLAVSMLSKTKCDFVMIGRGAIGYPFIFKECNELLKEKAYTPTLQERYNYILRFLELYNSQKKKTFSELKQQVMWSFKLLRGAREMRGKLVNAEDEKELKHIVGEYFKMCNENSPARS